MLASQEVFIYLLFAVIIVPVAKKLGLGSVLGYLLAGIIVGPLLGFVGDGTSGIQHFAEFGVVMMLFLIGLELKPIKLWQMRGKLIGLGGLQVILSTILLCGLALLFGNAWNKALAIGLILALSSTAIVLQTLDEKSWLKTRAGQSAFSVLLFQDIAVIPILAILPILALSPVKHIVANQSHPAFSSLPRWEHGLIIIAVFIALILAGRFLLNPLFKYIAQSRLIELFTAFVLLLIISIAFLMELLGLSAALGTFVAGVVLSESEYRHEIESQIISFKGLLLGIFFISIGASINFNLLFENASLICTWVIAIVIIKFIVLVALSFIFKHKKSDFWLFCLSLTQAGEFAFVLFAFARNINLFSEHETSLMYVIVALSMLITPVLFIIFEKIIMPSISRKSTENSDIIEKQGSAILVGVGRFGHVIARLLDVNNFDVVVVDHDATVVKHFRKFKSPAYYGNALKVEFLNSAGVKDAKLLIAATGNRETQVKLTQLVKKNFPHVKIIARAIDRHHVYELEEAGADFVIRELYDSSIDAAQQAMVMMGESKERAAVKVEIFKQHDAQTMTELKENWLKNGADKNYINLAISKIEELKDIIKDEMKK